MNRIEWKEGHLATGTPILRGSIGDIPAFTLRNKEDGRVMLTDRLQQRALVYDNQDGAKKAAENALTNFMERIGATFVTGRMEIQQPRLGGRRSDSGNKVLADTYRQMLQNLADGKPILDGFEDSALGGATRALRFWRNGWRFIQPKGDDKLELTDAGRKALETGEY